MFQVGGLAPKFPILSPYFSQEYSYRADFIFSLANLKQAYILYFFILSYSIIIKIL